MEYGTIIAKLQRSRFRSSFKLNEKDKAYAKEKGTETIRKHAYDFLDKRLRIKAGNDGRQTPFSGHPVFSAQHALALCCRKCMQKWHSIPEDRELNNEELDYFSGLIGDWVSKSL
jgi:hypothetical protein